jgi:hypothetical protein
MAVMQKIQFWVNSSVYKIPPSAISLFNYRLVSWSDMDFHHILTFPRNLDLTAQQRQHAVNIGDAASGAALTFCNFSKHCGLAGLLTEDWSHESVLVRYYYSVALPPRPGNESSSVADLQSPGPAGTM